MKQLLFNNPPQKNVFVYCTFENNQTWALEQIRAFIIQKILTKVSYFGGTTHLKYCIIIYNKP